MMACGKIRAYQNEIPVRGVLVDPFPHRIVALISSLNDPESIFAYHFRCAQFPGKGVRIDPDELLLAHVIMHSQGHPAVHRTKYKIHLLLFDEPPHLSQAHGRIIFVILLDYLDGSSPCLSPDLVKIELHPIIESFCLEGHGPGIREGIPP